MRDDQHQTDPDASEFESLLRSLAPVQSSTKETQEFFFRLGQQSAESSAAARVNDYKAGYSEKSRFGRMLAVAAVVVLAFGLGTQVNRLSARQVAADIAGTSPEEKESKSPPTQVSGETQEADASEASEPTSRDQPKVVRPGTDQQSWLAAQVTSWLKSEWNGRRMAIESIGGDLGSRSVANQLVSTQRDDRSLGSREAEQPGADYRVTTSKEQLLRELGINAPRRGVLGIY
ncbi:MAG TPA: hypothetical protein DDW52_03280 [Planctomycetaceae bacterium]|nr:hypothetical protein [Planctomycetaceae bacterium]